MPDKNRATDPEVGALVSEIRCTLRLASVAGLVLGLLFLQTLVDAVGGWIPALMLSPVLITLWFGFYIALVDPAPRSATPEAPEIDVNR